VSHKLILFPGSPTLLKAVPLFSQELLAMAERAVFLDRDNTLIDNDGYLGDPTKVKLLPGAATALSALRGLGYRLIVVSNQSGVARGMFDEAAVEAVNQEMCKQLRDQASAHIDASYYCPYHPEAIIPEYKADHDWRKPKPGMLLQAAADFALDLSQSWTIGDMPRDIAAGAAAGTRTILLRNPDHPAPAHDTNTLDVSPNFIVKTLADAARIISREGKNLPQAPTPATPIKVEPIAQKTVPTPPPTSEPSPAQTAVAIPATTDADDTTLADRIAQQLAKHPGLLQPAGSSKLERSLDELVIQLRQQNRNADLMPEFTMTKLTAMILQILAVVALIAGLYAMFSSPATFPDNLAFAKAVNSLQRAAVWTTTAVTLQGAVIALLLYARRK
jgi:D,D-heptose 1,7-bisphosphate phosphatase